MQVILLNSGGPDCLIAGAMVQEWDEKPDLVSLFIDMNPEARDRMLFGVAKNCDLLGIPIENRRYIQTPHVWDMWFLNSRNYWANPYLALHVHLVAAQYALHNDIENIVSGLRADASGYDWAKQLQELIANTGPGNEKGQSPVLWLPLLDYPPDYESTLSLANIRELPLDHTWSCNRYPPDLTCFKCRARERLGIGNA